MESSSDIKIDICSSPIEQSLVQNVLPLTTSKVIGITLDLEALASSSFGTITPNHNASDYQEKSFEQNCNVSKTKQSGRDVVFIVDKSGSMHSVISQVAQTIDRLAASLTESDRLCVITFSSNARTEVALQKIADCRNEVAECVRTLRADGSTNMVEALELAVSVVASEHETQKGENPNDRLVMLMMLSDGMPDGGSDTMVESTRALILAHCPKSRIVFNSFGFGSQHDGALLQSLTSIGTLSSGRYYYLSTEDDINSSVGDCLGAVNNITSYELKIEPRISGPWDCIEYRGSVSMDDTKDISIIGTMSKNERHTVVMLLFSHTTSEIPPTMDFYVSYKDSNQNLIKRVETYYNLAKEDEKDKYHILAHILRIKCAIGLQTLVDPAGLHRISEIEELHESVLETMGKVQQIESEAAIRDEGILSAVERDLGEALEKLNKSKGPSSQLRFQFLQYASEHLHQRSASSVSSMGKMSPYCTPDQVSMRIRFLYSSSSSSTDPVTEKSSVQIDDVSQDFLDRRREFEDEVCYITLDNWRTCQLGLGLLVRPRTARERYRGLVPVVELVEDYVSAEAYNRGVRGMVKVVDRDDPEEEDKHQALKSSVRGRVNAWLPLYINEVNWKYARAWAPSAFSIIATQFNDKFEPSHAMKVCAKLMVQTVVKSMIEDERVSDRAVQMYCDVHRLLLEMVREYPKIRTTAEVELNRFIKVPASRSRANTPDLGDIIMYLTVTDSISWSDIRHIYIQEAIRRNVLHVGHVVLPSVTSVSGLLDMWMSRTNSGRVTMFNVFFLDTIARPAGKSMEDIKRGYDLCWGKLMPDVLQMLKKGSQEILAVKTLPEVFRKLGIEAKEDAIAELILWAFENKEESAGREYPEFPKKGGKMLRLWKERSKLWKAIHNGPITELKYLPPPPLNLKRKYASPVYCCLNKLETSENIEVVKADCDCKRCQVELTIKSQRLTWKPQKVSEATVFVGKLPYSCTEEELGKAIGAFGNVVNVVLVKNCINKKPRGYGFVELSSVKDAQELVNYAQHRPIQIGDKVVIVDSVKAGFDKNFYPRRLGGGVGPARM